jgi:hypothetical protein
MAITPSKKSHTAAAGGKKMNATAPSKLVEGSPGAPVRKRGGGPKTPAGKARSSKNATKVGTYAKSPVIGDESQEDWEEFLDGLRASLCPQGTYEERLVDDIALNRQQRARLDRWEYGIVKGQVDHIYSRYLETPDWSPDNYEISVSRSLIPEIEDTEQLIRLGTFLDRRFDGLVRHLEHAQRARNNDLPPAARIELEGSG